jgi:hypothetical protein
MIHSQIFLQVTEMSLDFAVTPLTVKTQTDHCFWMQREAEDFAKYRDLCSMCDRNMLSKKELKAVADQTASAS